MTNATTLVRFSVLAAVLAAAVMAMAAALALSASTVAGQATITYNVTVENLTSGQPFTPPVVVAHSGQVDVFEVGQAASSEVQAIAENGNNDPLLTLLGGSNAVFDSATGTAPIMPGESATITVEAPAGSHLSAVMMLICTNDGFSGVDSVIPPTSGSESIDANAYDAGTENNTEDFADIVPPCQGLIGVTSDDAGTGETNPALAEGAAIAAHAGIQGGTDLTVADHGWTDPVAQITVTSAAGLPVSGGAPPDGGSGSLWALYLAIGGAAFLAAGGAFLVVSRRTVR